MVCKNCGAVIDDNAKFCGECGAVMSAGKGAAANTPAAAEPPKKKSGGAIIAICCLVLVLAVGFFGYKVLSGSSGEKNPEQSQGQSQGQSLEQMETNLTTLNAAYDEFYKNAHFYNYDESEIIVNGKPIMNLDIYGDLMQMEIKENESVESAVGKVFEGTATVNDVLAEKGIEVTSDFYSGKIDDKSYSVYFGYDSDPMEMSFKYMDDSSANIKGFKVTGNEPLVILMYLKYLGDVSEDTFADIDSVISYDEFLKAALGYDETDVHVTEYDVMNSDCATVNMLVKEAINVYKADIKTTVWNGKNIEDDTLSVKDILIENNLEYDDDFFSRKIDGEFYDMVVVYSDGYFTDFITIALDDQDVAQNGYYRPLTADMTISDFYRDNSAMESDCATTGMLIKEAVNMYLANNESVTWNGKTIKDSTLSVGDVLEENQIKYDSNYFKRKINDKTYEMTIVRSDSGYGLAKFNVVLGDDKDNIILEGVPLTDSITIAEIAEKMK